jgi:altronate hydrolase
MPLYRINPADNVAVSFENGHKYAVRAIAKGEKIIKYGFPIGSAICSIKEGEHVHTQNIRTDLSDTDNLTYDEIASKIPNDCAEINQSDNIGDIKTVSAYLRYNGAMGIRNELWIVPTVGCVNGQAQAIVDRVKREADISHIDDVRVYTHNYGCSQLGSDHENTRRALAALVKHPNAGGVLVLSLGCENNQLSDFKKEMGEWDEARVRFLVAQEVEDEVETGFRLMCELAENMRSDRRQTLPVSLLKVGLKCGGSDGFSGITANPLVGRFSDWLIANNGTAILTEVPEMFGAETVLMSRANSIRVFNETVAMINNFKDYFRQFGLPIYENPSPGNKEGGISTLEDKSIGCTQKGGTAAVTDVLQYARQSVCKGLNLLNAPGNDLVASSALALSGCQLILFTTGRGTPFGSFVPTLKISSNTKLYNYKRNWIDFNAGSLLEGKTSDALTDELIDFVIATVNGQKLKHEKAGCKEIAIFKNGVTL